jgi:Zn-dependent protease
MANTSKWGRFAAITVLLLGKSAKLMKAAKVAKPAITFISMALSVFAYAFWLGPWFAIGFVSMLFLHEMGHVFALRMRGYPAPMMVFIPFIGAAIFAPKFKDRQSEAVVGYGGPLLGSLSALVLFGAYFLLDKDSTAAHLVLITSYAAVFLNLFNMIPISPLDGGRITQATGTWFQYVGVAVLAIATAFFREPVMLYVWILVLVEISFISPKLRAIMATVCLVSMTILMLLGHSSQPYWVDIIDIVFGSVMTLVIVSAAWTGNDEIFAKDMRDNLPIRARIVWFVLYATLTASLVALLTYQSGMLPNISTKYQDRLPKG